MKKIFFLAVILLALLSCDKHGTNTGTGTDQSQTVSISLSLDELSVYVPDGGGTPRGSSPLTKTILEEGESKIDSLWILQFSSKSGVNIAGDGKNLLLNKICIATKDIPLDDDGKTLILQADLKLEPADFASLSGTEFEQQLRFLANVDNSLFDDCITYGGTNAETAFRLGDYDKMTIEIKDAVDSRIPMVAKKNVRIVEETKIIPDIELFRLYARVIASFYIDLTLRESDETDYSVKMDSVRVCNRPKKMNLDRWTVLNGGVEVCLDPGTTDTLTKIPTNDLEWQTIFYIPQNIGGVHDVTEKNGKDAGGTDIGFNYGNSSGPSVAYIEYEMLLTSKNVSAEEPLKNGTRFKYRIYLGANVLGDYNVLGNSSYKIETTISDILEENTNLTYE